MSVDACSERKQLTDLRPADGGCLGNLVSPSERNGLGWTAQDSNTPAAHQTPTKSKAPKLSARAVGVSRIGRALLSLADFSPEYIERLRRRMDAKTTPEPNTGCFLWSGALNSVGYGSIGIGLKKKRVAIVRAAHRVAWLLEHGTVADGLVLDHLCRNPACVNPLHLEPVTQKTNIARGMSPAAIVRRERRCSRGHELEGATRCRTCRDLNAARRAALRTLEAA